MVRCVLDDFRLQTRPSSTKKSVLLETKNSCRTQAHCPLFRPFNQTDIEEQQQLLQQQKTEVSIQQQVDEMAEDSLRTTLRSDNRGRTTVSANIAAEESNTTTTMMMEPLEGILKDPDSSGGGGGGGVDNSQAADKPANWHSRKISWGENDVFQAEGGFESSLPPLPKATTSRSQSAGSARSNESGDVTTTNDADASSSLGSPSIFRANRKYSGGRKIALDDVLRQSPMETEATTYIMRAIEQRELSAAVNPRDRSNSIMSNISDDALHHTLSNVAKRSDDENSSLGSRSAQQEQQTPSSTSSTRRLSLTSSKSPVNAYRRHRRTATMEERLFGLTSAIENAQQMWEEVYVDGAASQQASLEEPFTATINNTMEEPMSSADALQQNASILYHRAKSKRKLLAAGGREGQDENGSHQSDQSSVVSASSRWQKLRSAIVAGSALRDGAAKKADERLVEYDNENSSDDEEVGNVDSQSNGLASSKEQEQDNNDNDNLPGDKIRKEYERKLFREFQDFFDPHKGSVRFFVKLLICYAIIPIIGIAAILFYLAGNPPVGVLANGGVPVNGTLFNEDGEEVASDRYSASWMLLFLLRQILTGSLAKLTEFIVIDFLSIRSKGTVQLFGPWPTLFILQSKGLPFILTTWSIFNFCILYGPAPFFSHWLFFQEYIELFNRSNPSGNIIKSEWNRRILSIGVSVGLVVAIKRFWLGLYLGKQIFCKF